MRAVGGCRVEEERNLRIPRTLTPTFALLSNPQLEHVRGTLALSVVVAAAAAAIGYVGFHEAMPSEARGNSAVIKLPAIQAPPLLLRDIPPPEALSINRSIPFSKDPNPPGRPFRIRGDDAAYNRALECLTTAIYHEAGAETPDGQHAVAQVVLNRVRHPAFVPSVCGVVYHGSTRTTGCQFSFTCDGSLRRTASISGWAKARAIAEQALAGAVFKPVGYATHYHADYVVPYWATSLAKNAVIGRHIFYRWPGWWGTRGAFVRRHIGDEPDPRLLRDMALRRSGDRVPATASELVLETDPRVELMSVIQFLAAGSPHGEQSSTYENKVRLHFSGFSEHLAVQIYRQLSAGDSEFDSEAFLEMLMQHSDPPQLHRRGRPSRELIKAIGGRRKLLGFMSSLRDFVKHSDFETFFAKQQSFYEELAAKARKPALALLADVERDTGTPPQTARVILAPLLPDSLRSACQAVPNEAPETRLIVGVRDGLELPFTRPVQSKSAFSSLPRTGCVKLLSSPPVPAHFRTSGSA